MKSGPQRYPGASTSYWYGSKYPGSSMESNVIVWHTTEGTSLPSYSGGAEAPNFTAKPDFAAQRLVWYQHFDFDSSARALVNAAGGVETNTLNVCQVEIIGTCDASTHAKWTKAGYQHLYTPDLPDWAIRDLAAFAKWAHDNHGVPLTSAVTFKAYPASYGSGNGVRMSASKWNSFTGHCGHQHVPENLHGDPGLLPMGAILARAKGGTTTPSTPPTTNTTAETDMKLSDQVTLGDWVKQQWPDDKGLADKKISVNTAVGSGYAHARRSAENTDAILKQLEALRTEVAQLRATLTKGA
ncbi:hypothetical protein [Streptomyces sp. NPDC014793]|uniref:hypothetical protein n=1 Tax=Streptomyces sp. NPDC014793 TaxID=3364914 RepID=UPI0036FE0808